MVIHHLLLAPLRENPGTATCDERQGLGSKLLELFKSKLFKTRRINAARKLAEELAQQRWGVVVGSASVNLGPLCTYSEEGKYPDELVDRWISWSQNCYQQVWDQKVDKVGHCLPHRLNEALAVVELTVSILEGEYGYTRYTCARNYRRPHEEVHPPKE